VIIIFVYLWGYQNDVMISKYYIEITVAAVKLLDISSVLEWPHYTVKKYRILVPFLKINNSLKKKPFKKLTPSPKKPVVW